MARTRKTSKRVSAAKKYKIAKKVKEHHRKVRKEAKKRKTNKGLKRDPGIPNLYPFKEQLLKQIQERKAKAEEDKQRRKEERQQEQTRLRSLHALQKDAISRTKMFDKQQQEANEPASAATVRSHYKEFKKVVELSDVVLEVLDCRDPMGSRCIQMEQAVLGSGSNKKLVLVLNKIDLVPRDVVEKWLKYLRNEFPAIAFKANTQSQKQNLSQRRGALNTMPEGRSHSSACLGADTLLKLLGNYCHNAGIKTSITVGVVGLPNVGKSSLINSLKRSRACSVGAVPGLTSSIQEIQLDKQIKLLDSPGVIIAKGSMDDPALALRNCVTAETLSDITGAVETILNRCSKQQVLQHYCIPDYTDSHEFLAHLARRMGKLRKGGIPHSEAAARIMLRDWNTGRITYYTNPPELHKLPAHISAEIVTEWKRSFNLVSLEQEEKDDLKELTEKMESALVMESSVPVQKMIEDTSDTSSAVDEPMGSDSSDEEEDEANEMELENESHNKVPDSTMTVIVGKKNSTKASRTQAVKMIS